MKSAANKTLLLATLTTSSFIMDFTIRQRDGNENVKNNSRFSRHNNSFARASHIFVHFFAVFADYDVKLPDFTF